MNPPASLTLATWNINSVRLRIELVERFLTEYAPDVLCLQETKCPDDRFPHDAFERLGYGHVVTNGQKGYHGVATVARIELGTVQRRAFCGKGDSRHISVDVKANGQRLRIHNFYVPSGGDEPDPDVNVKFAHKLDFLDEMADWFADRDAHDAPHQILVGDLNVAPLETDVWSHKQLLRVVSHTPVEVAKLNAVQASARWVDVMRTHVPPEQKLFTWWSYRARDWRASNRGRRLDHIWSTPSLEGASTGITVVDAARDWERPSDHVPVIGRFVL